VSGSGGTGANSASTVDEGRPRRSKPASARTPSVGNGRGKGRPPSVGGEDYLSLTQHTYAKIHNHNQTRYD
jgi:hypothetical protein